MDLSLADKLYKDRQNCLHLENYQLLWQQVVCGACLFREGVIDELPSRTTIKEASGLFGGPATDPRMMSHLMVVVGLVPPDPTETMSAFRKRRRRQSWPSPKLFPFTSALWQLMGVQPPLARVFVEFCKGYSEIEIAQRSDLSLYNVTNRIVKAVHTSRKFIKVDHGYLS